MKAARFIVAVAVGSALLAAVLSTGCTTSPGPKGGPLAESYTGKNGTLEIGGPSVGAEFHHSRAVPSRISFFKPVANSIDLSTDYWQRDVSHPLSIAVSTGEGEPDSLWNHHLDYAWTPVTATFRGEVAGLPARIEYGFCDNLPAMTLRLILTNAADSTTQTHVDVDLNATLRTCQTYAWIRKGEARVTEDGATLVVSYPRVETDSAAVFFASVGRDPSGSSASGGVTVGSTSPDPGAPRMAFQYDFELSPGATDTLAWVIGSDRMDRMDELLSNVLPHWREDEAAYTRGIEEYALQGPAFTLADTSLQHTLAWSRAVLKGNHHWLNGHLVPMPCPAQYNFYFTHDAMLTDLAAVRFDLDRVKGDLEFLGSLSGPDSVLAHAYYWRDDGYKTEYCDTENWNHFWFLQVLAAYLRHGGDKELGTRLFPIAEHSFDAVISQIGEDGLAHGYRPDWWDIGTVPGARAYLTLHLVRAIDEFAYISQVLERPDAFDTALFAEADTMKKKLASELWDEDAGYLFNTIGDTLDRHYYIGSLLAPVYGVQDSSRSKRLVDTATNVLLDPKLGIRNVMPADFHLLQKEYHFHGPEAGGPYAYINGGVWPHGNAWYALAQIAVGRPNEALATLRNYMSLEGIDHSPNGLPSFYEFRHADPDRPDYGRIEKPTFLWAGGWYLYTLYQLAGVREEPWNLRLDPDLPDDFGPLSFDLVNDGICDVHWSGKGATVRRILFDGSPSSSLVLYGSPEDVRIDRGVPRRPYLEKASARVVDVSYKPGSFKLVVILEGYEHQPLRLDATGPKPPKRVLLNGSEVPFTVQALDRAARASIDAQGTGGEDRVEFIYR